MDQFETPTDTTHTTTLVRKQEKSGASFIYVTGFALLAITLHIIQWNQSAWEIVPLKLKEIANIATSQELYRIAKICEQQRKSECQQKMLIKTFALDSSHNVAALELGQIFINKKMWLEATQIYSIYLKLKNSKLQARLNYAIALSELNRFRDARAQFQHVISTNRDTQVQPNYVRTYVHYLIQNKDYVTAKILITKTRSKQKNAAYFLERELNEIDAHMRKSS